MQSKQIDKQKQQRAAWILLILLMLGYAAAMSYQTVLRYEIFKATAFDLGNMDQVLWNTIHGRLFQFTNQAIDWYGPPTRLAVHFEPIILPLSLLYLFHADPRILLVFQTLVLTTGALPVFLLTRKYIPQWPLLAPLMALAYLLSPALLGLNLFDFHPISLATPLLLYALLALEYNHLLWFVVACFLAATCKEDVPLTVAMIGIAVIWRYKHPRLGLALILGGCLWSFLAFRVIIPHFYPGVQSNNFWYRYEALGSSPTAAIGNLLLHPWLLFTTFITLDRLYYLLSLFRSAGFLGLLAPEWMLLALPNLAENLLSTDTLVFSGAYHYNAAIIPFVMLSSIHGAKRLLAIWQGWRGEKSIPTTATSPHVGASLAGALAARGTIHKHARQSVTRLSQRFSAWFQTTAKRPAQWVKQSISFLEDKRTWLARFLATQWQLFSERMTPLAIKIPVARLQRLLFAWIVLLLLLNIVFMIPSLGGFWADHAPGPREQHIQRLLDMIPPNASVSASSNMNPHVSERQRLAVFPSISASNDGSSETVQYIIVDLDSLFPEDRVTTNNTINQLVHSGQYRVLARADGVILLVLHST